MPQRETRHSIKRAFAEGRPQRNAVRLDFDQFSARMEQKLARLRDAFDPAELARKHAEFEEAVERIRIQVTRRHRRPGDGSMPALVEPPRGPKPLAGGAAAPLEFDDD